jgi:hypothetical protein
MRGTDGKNESRRTATEELTSIEVVLDATASNQITSAALNTFTQKSAPG